MLYGIFFTELGRSSLKELNKELRRDMIRELAPLVDHPRQGDALVGSLRGIWSLHVQKKYRILYRVDDERMAVVVELIGERDRKAEDDIYARATKILTTILRSREKRPQQ
jgi:addiction module RelE/StbE family toxin